MGRKWCWREVDSDTALGSFETKTEALEDAREKGEGRKILVGRCRFVEDCEFFIEDEKPVDLSDGP
jgi:hypothetical protein